MMNTIRFSQAANVRPALATTAMAPRFSGSHNIVDLTPENFAREVLQSDKPVLIDFWAPWCGPCRAMAPELQKFADARPDVKVVKANVQEHPEFSQMLSQLGSSSIPTLVLFKDGAPVTGVAGARNKEQLNAWVTQALA